MRTARAGPAWAWSGAAGAVAGCGLVVVLLVAGAAGAGAAGATGSLGTVVIADLGPGDAVTSQGPLGSELSAADAPDPGAARGALSMPAPSLSTYERERQAHGGLDQVQDLLVRFPGAVREGVFAHTAQHSRASGGNARPISPADAARGVRTQHAAKKEPSGGAIGAAVTVGAVLALALVTPLVLRRRRAMQEEGTWTVVLPRLLRRRRG